MTNDIIPSAQPAPVPALAPLTGRTHELKTDAHVFSEVTAGRKLFEIRKNDRDFRCGDLLRLRSTRCTGAEMAAGQPLIYTGEEITVRVIGILRGPVYGLAEGWVIMSIAAPAATQAQAEPVLWVNAGTLELVRMAGKATISASSEKNAEEGNGTPLYTRPAIASAPVGDGATTLEPATEQQKLRDLADRIDPEELWRRSTLDRFDGKMTPKQVDRMDAGVALRRYAELLEPGRWLVFPPAGGIRFSANTLAAAAGMAQRDEERRAARAAQAGDGKP